MLTQRWSARAALVLGTLAATACGTDRSTGPNGDVRLDAHRLIADVAATEHAMRPSVLASFTALSASFDLEASATVAIAGSRELSSARDDLTIDRAKRVALTTAERLMSASLADVALASPALPPGSLGTTYIYDPAVRRYVAAPGRTGAPPNGVRFILYALNPVTQEPIVAVEVGHADLIDDGIASAPGLALRLIVVSGETTYLDYRVALEGSASAGSLAVTGFLTDGETRVDFDIEASGTAGPTAATMNVAFEFGVPARDFSVAGTVEGAHSADGGLGRIDLSVRSGQSTIDVAMTGDDHTVNATFLVDGRIFATVTGDHRDPVVRGAGGRELSAEEVAALRGILQLVGGVFELFGNLLEPVGAILLLSTIP
jgi:hypothetical protein